jgi:hypothetical protein
LFTLWWLVLFILSVLFLCTYVIIISIVLAYVATALLYVGEFAVRRIAEYQKGPVLALSAIFGSLVAIIKAFA